MSSCKEQYTHQLILLFRLSKVCASGLSLSLNSLDIHAHNKLVTLWVNRINYRPVITRNIKGPSNITQP